MNRQLMSGVEKDSNEYIKKRKNYIRQQMLLTLSSLLKRNQYQIPCYPTEPSIEIMEGIPNIQLLFDRTENHTN